MATPARSPKVTSKRTTPMPQTPKDVRQLDRDEMIEYLQTHDEEIPNNVEEWKRTALKKRVIQCMKQKVMPIADLNLPTQKTVQSAIPKVAALPRISRKRKNELPLTGTRNKRMRTTVNGNNQALQRLLPITSLVLHSQEISQSEHKDEDIDLSALQINLEFKESENNDAMRNTLLNAVRNGIPARYDIVPLSHSIVNNGCDTSYLRSAKMQNLFEKCHIEQEIHCAVRTSDDVYQLSNDDIQQIEGRVYEWTHKYGQYSSNIHPSVVHTCDNTIEAKDYIFQHEVLGRFVGDELTENEFHEIYTGTFDQYRRSLHSWVFEVDIPVMDKNSNCDDGACMKYDQYDMLVDCLGKNKKYYSELLLIEDCREDLSKRVTTKEDLNKENVLFITIEINGWPGKFAIAKRNINKNEILYGHFGDGYSSLRKQVKRQQQSVDLFVSSIQELLQQQ